MKKAIPLLFLALPGCSTFGGGKVHDGGLLYTSPGGLEVWGLGSGATSLNSTGIQSDGTKWMTVSSWDEVGKAMESGVASYARNHPAIPSSAVWAQARRTKYYLHDDYTFPIFGVPADAPNARWAAGETDSNKSDPKMTLAIWSRHEVDAVNPPPSNAPSWTIRKPGYDGHAFWRWGERPLVPAVEFELGWFFGTNK